jgi:hypothetical protein
VIPGVIAVALDYAPSSCATRTRAHVRPSSTSVLPNEARRAAPGAHARVYRDLLREARRPLPFRQRRRREGRILDVNTLSSSGQFYRSALSAVRRF